MTQGAGADEMRAEQEVLGGALERLGRRLHRHTTADPLLATETLLLVLATLREWLETGVALGAVEAAGRPQLEAWEEQLATGGAYLGALRQAIQSELALSSRLDECLHGRQLAARAGIPRGAAPESAGGSSPPSPPYLWSDCRAGNRTTAAQRSDKSQYRTTDVRTRD